MNERYISFSMAEWHSWNHYHCSINETVVRQTADTIVATGLAAAGYQYGRVFFSITFINHYLLLLYYSEFG